MRISRYIRISEYDEYILQLYSYRGHQSSSMLMGTLTDKNLELKIMSNIDYILEN